MISDSCEENPNDLYAAARRLNGVPAVHVSGGRQRKVAGIYAQIASITKGASCQFDSGAAARLADLLKAVVAFATGGRKALGRSEHRSSALAARKDEVRAAQ